MNEETKHLIEKAVTDTQTDIFENIRAIKSANSNYRANLARLKSYAESLGYSENDVIEVLGFSIEEIEQAKEKAIEGEMMWRHNLEKAAWERKQEEITDDSIKAPTEWHESENKGVLGIWANK